METKPASTLTVIVFWCIVAGSIWSCVSNDPENTESSGSPLTSEEVELAKNIKGLNPDSAWMFGSTVGKVAAAKASPFGKDRQLEVSASMIARLINVEDHAAELGINVEILHSFARGYSDGFTSERDRYP